jgi:hypothetical protein
MTLDNQMMRFTAFTSILRCTFTLFAELVGCGEVRTASIGEMMWEVHA